MIDKKDSYFKIQAKTTFFSRCLFLSLSLLLVLLALISPCFSYFSFFNFSILIFISEKENLESKLPLAFLSPAKELNLFFLFCAQSPLKFIIA